MESGFGIRLKSERMRLGFTQVNLAKLIGVKPLTLLQYEKGNSSPTMKLVYRLRELGFNVNYMVNGDEQKSISILREIPISLCIETVQLSEKVINTMLKDIALSDAHKLKLQLLVLSQLLSDDIKDKDLKIEAILDFVSQIWSVAYEPSAKFATKKS